jgi:hypothetical protein
MITSLNYVCLILSDGQSFQASLAPKGVAVVRTLHARAGGNDDELNRRPR